MSSPVREVSCRFVTSILVKLRAFETALRLLESAWRVQVCAGVSTCVSTASCLQDRLLSAPRPHLSTGPSWVCDSRRGISSASLMDAMVLGSQALLGRCF